MERRYDQPSHMLKGALKPVFPELGFDIENLSPIIADLGHDQVDVPVLLHQYLKLGGRVLGFHVDREFSDVLDGLILVDLTTTEPKLLERYLGKRDAAAFLAYHNHSLTGRV